MEISKNEIAQLSEAVGNTTNDQVHELDELQLALVGGGYGETIL
jgi:hypothetical protein